MASAGPRTAGGSRRGDTTLHTDGPRNALEEVGRRLAGTELFGSQIRSRSARTACAEPIDAVLEQIKADALRRVPVGSTLLDEWITHNYVFGFRLELRIDGAPPPDCCMVAVNRNRFHPRREEPPDAGARDPLRRRRGRARDESATVH
jgi:hypothetical protein